MGIKINKAYKPLITSKKRYFLLTGGRGSLKSTTVHDYSSRLSYQKNHGILVTRYTMSSAEKSIIPEFESSIKLNGSYKDFVKSGNKYTNIHTGSFILFSGIKTNSGDQTANLKSIEGLSTWILDEAEELTDEDKFDTINLSVRQKGVQNRVIMMMNPTTKEHWIYKRFFTERGVQGGSNTIKEDTNYIHTTYLDNLENLSPSYIKDIERLKRTNQSKFCLLYTSPSPRDS